MQFLSRIRRFFSSIMASASPFQKPLHLIFMPIDYQSASSLLELLKEFKEAPGLLGHLIVAEMQLCKRVKTPEHEFVVARVAYVKEANAPHSKELRSVSILIDRNVNNDPSVKKPMWEIFRRSSASSRASSETAAASRPDADSEASIHDTHIHSMSAPDLAAHARAQEYPPFSADDASPAAVDAGAKSSVWSMLDSRPILRASVTSSESSSAKPAYDRFDLKPNKTLKDILNEMGAVCMANMNFTSASRPLLFEELAMMAKVTSESARRYSTPTTQCYWYSASVWGMVILYTGAKPEGIKNQLRLRVGALKGVLLPAHVFGVDDDLKPAELLKTFRPKWTQYKAELIQAGKAHEEEADRRVKEAETAKNEAEAARDEAEARSRRDATELEASRRKIAELQRTMAEGNTSAA